MITLILDQMKEIVTKILDVIMFLVPFFGKKKTEQNCERGALQCYP